jgi:hypothetical protein
MNWSAYLVLARGLAGHRFEASERTAVSRAYYGAFNLSRRWLEANVTPIDNRRAHEQVWETFRTADRATAGTTTKWELVGELGARLRVLRNRADYEDRALGPENQAPGAVGAAERIVALLEELEVAE